MMNLMGMMLMMITITQKNSDSFIFHMKCETQDAFLMIKRKKSVGSLSVNCHSVACVGFRIRCQSMIFIYCKQRERDVNATDIRMHVDLVVSRHDAANKDYKRHYNKPVRIVSCPFFLSLANHLSLASDTNS
jgi:hypothetical protein